MGNKIFKALKKLELESLVIKDKYFSFTALSIVSTLVLLLNSVSIMQPVLGMTFCAIFFIVDGTFLAHIFFEDEKTFLRIIFGLVTLLILIVIVNVPLVLLNQFNAVANVLSLSFITIGLSIVNRKVRLVQSMDAHEHSV